MENFVLYENISQLLTLSGVAKKQGRNIEESDLGILQNASVLVNQSSGKIEWVGPSATLPKQYEEIQNRVSSIGEVWLPTLVESHTHFLFGGTRHHDFSQRCRGKTYQEIAAEGGGILTTMKKTREISFDELYEHGKAEIERFEKFGIGVIEVKTGYGLTFESELKVLEVIQKLQSETSLVLVATFLPAHAVPPEFKERPNDYVKLICEEWIPEVSNRKLANFFDVFIEKGYFDTEQGERLCQTALDHGMKLKLHVDQFNDIGGTELAVRLGARSVDHLDQLSDKNIQILSKSDTVAVMLPGASLFTGTPYPPARKLLDAGAIVALSTDYNPGTCPSRNLPLMTTLACTQMKMKPEEAIAGITYNAALSLDLQDRLGSLEVGKEFRIMRLPGDSYEILPYCFGELN